MSLVFCGVGLALLAIGIGLVTDVATAIIAVGAALLVAGLIRIGWEAMP
jgi:hypothetical protein